MTIYKGLFSYQVHQIESPSPYAARITTPFIPRRPLLWDRANSEHSSQVQYVHSSIHELTQPSHHLGLSWPPARLYTFHTILLKKKIKAE